ncbi:hypothetical protein [Shewanella sp. YIC-542]|uniref:hypothetical protein n=1 Tax=Shewanella mytili TaxID=3377111 RepID=UPI00398EDAC2
MTKLWPWLLLVLLALLAFVNVYHGSQQKPRQLLLNCSVELYDHDTEQQTPFYLLLDLQAAGHDALINYRYFHTDGTPAGSVLMRGRITRGAAGSNYKIVVSDKEEQQGKGNLPEHMQYLSYISSLNLNNHGTHTMTLEVLDTNDAQHYAVVRVQPDNGVYGCRIQQ